MEQHLRMMVKHQKADQTHVLACICIPDGNWFVVYV
jgi:hypothetical protein